MRAGLRFGIAAFAAGLALGPSPALAQAAPEPATTTPATDTIGPRELQNFSLNGTVTRQADPAPAPPRQPQPAARTADRAASAPAATENPPSAAVRRAAAEPPPTSERRPGAGQALALDLPPATPASTALAAGAPQPGFAAAPEAAPATLAPEHKLLLWPWLLLAAVIGAGIAALLFRRRSREAFAGAADYDAYVAPEPAAPPRAAPAPPPAAAPPAAAPKPAGIVSARLRPWLDLGFAPLGCTVDEERVVVEFEVHLTNSGSAPARDILVEASMFNAGPTQDRDIGAFFAEPVGQGERIETIAPLQNLTIRTSLVAPRANIQVFELGGRQVFVPLVAFNALYRAGSAGAQTSAAYLLGRATDGEKLGPLRADLGARAFTRLGVRPLPIGVRN